MPRSWRFGISVGMFGWAPATAVGVAAILAASATVFTSLKIAGRGLPGLPGGPHVALASAETGRLAVDR